MRTFKVLALTTLTTTAVAGPVSFSLCQAACAATLYGTEAYGACQAACWVAAIIPIP